MFTVEYVSTRPATNVLFLKDVTDPEFLAIKAAVDAAYNAETVAGRLSSSSDTTSTDLLTRTITRTWINQSAFYAFFINNTSIISAYDNYKNVYNNANGITLQMFTLIS